jgi:hypothetical protein
MKPLIENSTYSSNINLKQEIAKLTKHMIDKGENILPLPKLILRNGNKENAKDFLGKTAYYDPNTQTIVLYTEGRHPKDLVKSYSHEIQHHIQNLENRLNNISTTNTNEDDHLDKIEREAYLNGNMIFRNWTDSLNENIFLEQEDKLTSEVINPDGDIFIYEEISKGLFTYKDSLDNLYFVRIVYQPTNNPYFEFKVGWFENNNTKQPKYDPQLPSNSTAIDNIKRRNTVAKIYRDEILPFFKENQNYSNSLLFKPISNSRFIFSKRLIQNHTPPDFEIKIGKNYIKINNKTNTNDVS